MVGRTLVGECQRDRKKGRVMASHGVSLKWVSLFANVTRNRQIVYSTGDGCFESGRLSSCSETATDQQHCAGRSNEAYHNDDPKKRLPDFHNAYSTVPGAVGFCAGMLRSSGIRYGFRARLRLL